MPTVHELKERLKSLKENGPSKPSDYLNLRVRLKVDADRFDSFIAPKGLEGTVVEATDTLIVVRTDNAFDCADGKSQENEIQYHIDHAFGSGDDFLTYLGKELEIIGITTGATNYLGRPFPIKAENTVPKKVPNWELREHRFDPYSAYFPLFVWMLGIFILGFAFGGISVLLFR